MLPASKHMDLVMGVDIHIIMIPTPGGPVPTPIPHPFIGIIFDPADYNVAEMAKSVGIDITPVLKVKKAIDAAKGMTPTAKFNELKNKAQGFVKKQLGLDPPKSKGLVKVNGLPRTHVGTKGKALPPHIPMGGPFQAGKVGNECEAFMGSMTVAADEQPFSFLGCMVESCHCPGKMKPTSVILTIPMGPMVLVGGPPVPSLSLLASKAFDKLANKAFASAMGALKKSKAMKAISQKIHNAAGKAMDKMGCSKSTRDLVHKKICEKTGHPVIIATGQVYTTQTDFVIPGPIPLQWTREWKSTAIYEGPFGRGWHLNYDLALGYEEDAVVIRMEDGRPVIFPPLEVGESYTNAHENLTLTRTEKSFVMRDEDNLCFEFDLPDPMPEAAVFPLNRIKNTAGHQLQFFYSQKGHLQKIIDSGNRTFQVSCDMEGRITKIEAPHPEKRGETFILVEYKYDRKGDLVEQIDALGNSFLYEYENHLLVKETNRNGLSFYFEYDGEDSEARCIHTWGDNGIYDHKLHYNLEDRWTEVTDSLGNTSKYFWNEDGVNWKIVDPYGHERYKRYTATNKVQSEINELGEITSYEYDEFGNQTAIHFADGASVSFEYDDNLLVGATDQIGGTWRWEYNEDRQLIRRTNPLGYATEFEYENGLLQKITDPLGGETMLEFTPQHNLSTLVSPDGARAQWRYDMLGRPLEAIDAKGNVQKRKFNYHGWIIKVHEADGNIRHIEYDAEGNLTHVSDKHQEVKFEYADMNRLKARTEAGTRVEFKYDTEGNLLGIINEHGYAYRFELDKNFEVVSESGFDGVTRIYKRDEAGRVTEVERASGIVTNYNFDPRGRVVAVEYSDGQWEKLVYREDGQLMEANNNVIKVQFERDALGRIIKETQGGFTVESEYNEVGLRTHVSSNLGANLTFGRNLMGDVQEVISENGQGINWKANFERDIYGLELERTLPGDVRSQWKRDQLGRPIEQKTYTAGGNLSKSREYVWDVDNRLKKIIDNQSGVTEFEHDVFGNLAAATYGDGSKEYRMPDEVGNLFRKQNRQDRKYGPAGQLLEADGTQYEYDPEGNLIKKIEKNGSIWQYEWNGTGMLTKVTRPDNAEVTFLYDALGRRVAKSFRGRRTRWIWHGNVMLHEWVETYKQQPQLKSKIIVEESSHVKIRKREEVLVDEPANAPPVPEEIILSKLAPTQDDLTTWVFEPESFAPIAKLNGKENFSIVTDHLGTPVGMYSDAGEKVWEMGLSIYGEVRNMEGWRAACPFRYPGQYEDIETGLFYNRFRYYDPEGGVYVSQDPIRLHGGLLLYSYSKDINLFFDVFGLSTVYLRNNETYVGKAKQNAQTRYGNKNTATDIFTDIPDTDTAQGVEQITYERMKKMEAEGVIDPMTNVNRPVNMDDKEKRKRRDKGEAWLKEKYGEDYEKVIDQKVKDHYCGD